MSSSPVRIRNARGDGPALVAYVMQRRADRTAAIVSSVMLAGLIIPPAVVPTIFVLQEIGLYKTLIGLIFVEVALQLSFATLVFRAFMATIPKEIDEAAIMDGASPFQVFFRVILPLLRPAITPAAILSAITTFQMFNTVYLITLGGPITSPLKPGFTSFVMIYIYQKLFGDTAGNPRYGALAAVAVLIFVILLALTIVASLQAVGVILVVAMLVTPGCVGFLLTDRFHRMLGVAVATAVFATLMGTYVSFFLNGSTGACIVLAQALVFVVALAFAPKRGLLAIRRIQRPGGKVFFANPKVG